ncbi:MAG: tRNA 2-thiouridine(34) synthase MnmA, partial [Desulfovibrio sp.]|nr:tRNA 2-thiouridine(34) synthase MnmA [Desulfovibrio sp.]
RQKGLKHAYFATGHYARAFFLPRFGRHVLRRGRDIRKDQSYFLYRLTQEQIRRALFPLGEMTKEEVRALAARHRLPMRDAPDSQDFYSGDYTELLALEERPGNIVDASGRVLGRHSGFWRFTPGQRRGLGIAADSALYVLRLDASRNEVVVGPYRQSLRSGCILGDLCLHIPLTAAGKNLRARMRSSQPPVPVATREGPAPDLLAVDFDEPQQGVAPGQSLVFYLDDLVLGGGIIRADANPFALS